MFLTNRPDIKSRYNVAPNTAMNRISTILTSNIQTAIDYSRESAQVAQSQHPLVRMCHQLLTDGGLYEWLDHGKDMSVQLPTVYGMVSEHSAGEYFDGEWIYENAVEVVLCSNNVPYRSVSDVASTKGSYKALRPLTIRSHTAADLTPSLDIPLEGTVYMELNITLLTVQLNAWNEEQRLELERDSSYVRDTIPMFVQKYVLTNALWSQIEISFYNALLTGTVSDKSVRTPYFTPAADRDVSNYLETADQALEGKTFTLEELLSNVFTFTDRPALQLFSSPKVPANPNTYHWLLGAQLIPAIYLLTKYDVTDSSALKVVYKRSHRLLRATGSGKSTMDRVLYDQLLTDLETLITLVED